MQRFGRIRKPFYKIVAVDARKARNSQPIEYLGTWDPLVDKAGKKKLRLSEDRVKYWLTVGAQPSDTVAKLLWRINMLPKPPVTYKPKRSIPKNEREFSTFISRNIDFYTPSLPAFVAASNDIDCVSFNTNDNNEINKVMYIEPFFSLMKNV
eukprot:g9587.t1